MADVSLQNNKHMACNKSTVALTMVILATVKMLHKTVSL